VSKKTDKQKRSKSSKLKTQTSEEPRLRVQVDTDCEGPLALNDNAFELCRDFLPPRGDRFFQQVSHYEDYLAAMKKPDYKAGDTLKLILPFLKAAGLTNAQIRDYSLKTMRLMPGAEAAYRFLHGRKLPLFEISTSYRQFAEAVGVKLGFDTGHIFCTEMDLDKYRLTPGDAEELGRLQQEIIAAPAIELPAEAASLADLPGPTQEALGRFEQIFCEKIPAMDIGVIYREVSPVGGFEKARALSDSVTKSGCSLAEVIYVGDSITDVQAFEAVRAGGGLAVSFNGNRHAIGAAEVAVVADTAWPIALFAAVFELWGKEGIMELAAPETRHKSRALVLPENVIEPIMQGLQGSQFNLYLTKSPNREKIIGESAAMRAKLRGDAVAGMS
jgi:energy-converting hydrogenase A subunit R